MSKDKNLPSTSTHRRLARAAARPSSSSALILPSRHIIVIERTIALAGETGPWGIDVSHHNETIDFKSVKDAGATFAFIKSTEGGTYVDPMYATNRRGFKSAGIASGAYHFFRPKTSVESQVDNFCRTVGRVDAGDMQPVLDVEDPSLWKGISAKDAVDMSIAWCDGVKAKLGSGLTPIIYLSPSFADGVFKNDARLKDYPLWIANYKTPAPRVPRPWEFWTFWQYTETGTVPGITGNVDVNRFNGWHDRFNALLVKESMLDRPRRGRRSRRSS